MAEDDPFADLGETLGSGSGGNVTEEDAPAAEEAEANGGDVEDGGGDPTSDSAFGYEAANQRPFYAREATIEAFDAWLNYELERELSERGYRNIVVREMTDALLRTVVEEDLVDEVAARFESARRNPNE